MDDQQRMEFFCTAQCIGLSDEELKDKVTELLKERRVPHVLGCAETAVRLAKIWGADVRDAYRAGILHDVTKALDGEQQLALCQRLGISMDAFSRENPKTLHQLTGAVVAQRVFGENEAVQSAIATHTTGCAGMTTLQKIIYIADYMEPNRDFQGVEAMRELAVKDLDAAMKMGLQMTMTLLKQQGKEICAHSLAAWNDLEKEK